MRWTEVCERLWGSDWIAPLSEVIRVNRRTVERWRSGANPIPDAVRVMLERISQPDRAYGSLLRRIAGGETPEMVRDAINEERRALMIFENRLRDGDPLAVLASAGDRP